MPKVSIIIISYNRPDETVDAMKNVLFETDTPKGHELEVVVINNGSTKDYSACEQYVEQLPSEQKTQVKYVNSQENLGVSRGRNLGVETVTGDYVVFIDDDAVFKSQDALQKLVNTFEAHEEDNVGILALDIENFFTGEPDHPVKNESKLIEDEFYNNIFWGCGFAVRKKVFDEIGAFEPAFFYGMEEYDFAYRAMDKGYKIWFTKHVMVLHKVSPAGREPNVVKFSRMLQNKSLIAYRYLPWKYVFTHLFMWSGFFLTKSKWKFGKWLKALAGYNQMVKNDKRTPISSETLAYIKSVKGRLTH